MQNETNMMTYLNETELGYFDELKTQIGETESAGTDVDAAALPNLGELCKKYNQIKGTLELALKAVEKIPGIGKKVAKAVRFLMSVADFACQADGGPEEFAAADANPVMSLSLEQIEHLNRLDAALTAAGGGFGLAASDMTAMSFNKAEMCAQYHKVRKFIGPVLIIIGLIPGVGGTVVAAIKLLMGIADSICGGGDN